MNANTSWPRIHGELRQDYAPLLAEPQDVGVVYFLGWHSGKIVKVGWSQNFWDQRLKAHIKEKGVEHPPTVLAVVRGSKKAEAAIKAHFTYARVNPNSNEEFQASAVVPYLAWLRDQYFVSLTRDDFFTDIGQTQIEESVWLPGPGRISDRRSEPDLFTFSDPWAILPSRDITGDDWYTPQHIVECGRQALGGQIDLDPASHVIANRIVKARRFYTVQQNGLTQPWGGRVWLNPPFSSWPQWAWKLIAERESCEAIVALAAIRTMTALYFEPLLAAADALCIISGRNAFWGIQSTSTSPTDGHVLLYFGPDLNRFTAAVTSLGRVWKGTV